MSFDVSSGGVFKMLIRRVHSAKYEYDSDAGEGEAECEGSAVALLHFDSEFDVLYDLRMDIGALAALYGWSGAMAETEAMQAVLKTKEEAEQVDIAIDPRLTVTVTASACHQRASCANFSICDWLSFCEGRCARFTMRCGRARSNSTGGGGGAGGAGVGVVQGGEYFWSASS